MLAFTLSASTRWHRNADSHAIAVLTSQTELDAMNTGKQPPAKVLPPRATVVRQLAEILQEEGDAEARV